MHLKVQSFLKLLEIYCYPHYLHVFYILKHVFYGLYKAKNWCMLIIINKYISIQYFHFFAGSCRQRCKTELFPFDTFYILMSSYTLNKYKHSSICLIIKYGKFKASGKSSIHVYIYLIVKNIYMSENFLVRREREREIFGWVKYIQ